MVKYVILRKRMMMFIVIVSTVTFKYAHDSVRTIIGGR